MHFYQKAPSTKLQAPGKLQTSKYQKQRRVTTGRPVGAWNLKFLWSLELGIWSFVCLHPPPALVEFVTRQDRIDVLARPGEIDLLEECFRRHRFRVVAPGPTQSSARAGVIFGEREWQRIRLVLPMLNRSAQIPCPCFQVCLRIE